MNIGIPNDDDIVRIENALAQKIKIGDDLRAEIRQLAESESKVAAEKHERISETLNSKFVTLQTDFNRFQADIDEKLKSELDAIQAQLDIRVHKAIAELENLRSDVKKQIKQSASKVDGKIAEIRSLAEDESKAAAEERETLRDKLTTYFKSLQTEFKQIQPHLDQKLEAGLNAIGNQLDKKAQEAKEGRENLRAAMAKQIKQSTAEVDDNINELDEKIASEVNIVKSKAASTTHMVSAQVTPRLTDIETQLSLVLGAQRTLKRWVIGLAILAGSGSVFLIYYPF